MLHRTITNETGQLCIPFLHAGPDNRVPLDARFADTDQAMTAADCVAARPSPCWPAPNCRQEIDDG